VSITCIWNWYLAIYVIVYSPVDMVYINNLLNVQVAAIQASVLKILKKEENIPDINTKN
jgi:hypothetical protein